MKPTLARYDVIQESKLFNGLHRDYEPEWDNFVPQILKSIPAWFFQFILAKFLKGPKLLVSNTKNKKK